jgi:hypothetical protein
VLRVYRTKRDALLREDGSSLPKTRELSAKKVEWIGPALEGETRMIHFVVILAAILFAAATAHAQNDPRCQPEPDVRLQSVSVLRRFVCRLYVTADATGQIYVCGLTVWAAASVRVDLIYGTTVSTPCDTGTTKITSAYQLTSQTGFVEHLPVYTGVTPVPVGNNLCINTSQGVAVQAIVYLTRFP